MTDYADVTEINALYAEQAQIQAALDILDDEGTVSWTTIAPTAASANQGAFAVAVHIADPPQSMLAGIRTGLIQRYNAINQELRDLGITGTPPDQGGGPPIVETQPV